MVYISHMHRTQIYLHNDQAQQIALLARQKKQHKARVIRALIQKGIDIEKKETSAGDALLKLAELGKKLNLKGPTDLSVNHDKYLYEE